VINEERQHIRLYRNSDLCVAALTRANVGFSTDPTLSAHHNACLYLASMPVWLYHCRPLNTAFHNLALNPPSVPGCVRQLLGLGLNFCPRTLYPTASKDTMIQRFNTDVLTKVFFTGEEPLPPNQLFIRSDWNPPFHQIPTSIHLRLADFSMAYQSLYTQRRHCSTNLLPVQTTALTLLRKNPNFIVFKTDKNLGPAITERHNYICTAIRDHLSTETYKQISADDIHGGIQTVRNLAGLFIWEHFKDDKDPNKKFLLRSLDVKDPFAYFYLLAKVHKSPWTTRPIVSVSGSLLHGIGRWLDKQLQVIVTALPYVLRSSFDLVKEIRQLPPLPPNARLFTCDATSMYTNIDRYHAIGVIFTFFRTRLPILLPNCQLNLEAILDAIRLVMSNNYFKFGDTFWKQICGTAMGTPPAPMYATLYFAIHEMDIIPTFPSLWFYRRYIDDGFGIWIPNNSNHPSALTDDQQWLLFQQAFNNFGQLRWTFSPRTTTADYLDLTLRIHQNTIDYSLFEKILNLYLYLPAHTAHPPGVLNGTIAGMLTRIFRLTANIDRSFRMVKNLFRRLCQRGYRSDVLRPLFEKHLTRTYNKVMKELTQSNITTSLSVDPTPVPTPPQSLFLHCPYHPANPPPAAIHHLFNKVFNPIGDIPLADLKNMDHVPFGPSRLILAHHRPRNLGNHLAPRRLHDSAWPVSSYLTVDSASGINPNPNPTPTRALPSQDV
jgi:hypothetical protein